MYIHDDCFFFIIFNILKIHPELLRLPANSLRGTFLKAYELLVKIVRKIGWNKLLFYRSSVFVMEEEYRIQRANIEKKQQEKVIIYIYIYIYIYLFIHFLRS